MNKFYYLLILVVFTSCMSNNNESEKHLDYLKNPINDYSIVREYRLENDTIEASLFAQQYLEKISDSTFELKYIWKRSDSIPINKGVERHYSNNTGEFISQSFFEGDSINIFKEVKANVISKKRFILGGKKNVFVAQYRFKNDSNLIMTIHSESKYEFKNIDTLNVLTKKYLVAQSIDKTILEYSDVRGDITINSIGIRYYEKGKGLVLFIQDDGTSRVVYKLVE